MLSCSDDTLIFLDKDCSASSTTYGNGKWEWSNGGFTIDLEKKSFGFPRQALEIDDQGKCQAGASDEENADTRPPPARSPKGTARAGAASAALIRQVYDLCARDQVETAMSKWGEDPENRRALAIERANALRKAHNAANSMCNCVVLPLKNGKQIVGTGFVAQAGYYKRMQFACSMESGPEEFIKQFGH